MLTYQLQRRAFHIMEEEKTFSFPNTVEVEIILEPTEMFGVGKELTKTFVPGHDLQAYLDPDTGKCGIVPDHLFDPIEAVVEWKNINQRLEMHGNKLIAQCKCNDRKDLVGFLTALYYIFPLLLTIEFVEPPVVKSIVGRVGEVPFRWEFAGYRFGFDSTSKEIQEQRVIDSFGNPSFTCDLDNRRLAAALSYFYTAKRLRDSGNSQYEFMAEVVLNYCKVLEVLFSGKKDKAKQGLSKLGYIDEDIEDNFITLFDLRNQFDVGHSSLTIYNQQQLTDLYEYLEDTEHIFRELLRTVMDKVKDGSYQLKRDSDFKPKNEKLKILDEIFKIQQKRKTKNRSTKN